MKRGFLFAGAVATAICGGSAFAETYLPGEGDFEVSVYQTTGEDAFCELPTTPFTRECYTNRVPLDVDTCEVRSTYRGLGVSLTDASAWILSRMPVDKRTALLESVFSKDKGAGLSGVRLNIGASDYSTGIYCYNETPGDVEMKNFSLARDEHWVIPMAKEVLSVNPETFFFAAPWSPPAWMKTTNNFIDGHFKDGCEQAMANYLAAYVREMGKRGIPVGAVTAQNEAALSTRGTYPCCVFGEEQEKDVCKLLKKRLLADGLKTEVWLWDWDPSKEATEGRLLRQLSDPELLASVDAVAWHSYSWEPERFASMYPLKQQFPKLHFYHTEMGPAKHDAKRTERWWCQRIGYMLENGCEAFTGWNLCLTKDGQPLTGPHLCMGLMTVDLKTGDFTPSAQYTLFRHIGPFVKKGAEILRANGNLDGCETLLFRNPGDEYVLIVASDGMGKDKWEPRPKIYVRCQGQMKHLPLPYGTWSVTTLVFKKK